MDARGDQRGARTGMALSALPAWSSAPAGSVGSSARARAVSGTLPVFGRLLAPGMGGERSSERFAQALGEILEHRLPGPVERRGQGQRLARKGQRGAGAVLRPCLLVKPGERGNGGLRVGDKRAVMLAGGGEIAQRQIGARFEQLGRRCIGQPGLLAPAYGGVAGLGDIAIGSASTRPFPRSSLWRAGERGFEHAPDDGPQRMEERSAPRRQRSPCSRAQPVAARSMASRQGRHAAQRENKTRTSQTTRRVIVYLPGPGAERADGGDRASAAIIASSWARTGAAMACISAGRSSKSARGGMRCRSGLDPPMTAPGVSPSPSTGRSAGPFGLPHEVSTARLRS